MIVEIFYIIPNEKKLTLSFASMLQGRIWHLGKIHSVNFENSEKHTVKNIVQVYSYSNFIFMKAISHLKTTENKINLNTKGHLL